MNVKVIDTNEDGWEVREGCKTEKSTRELSLPTYLYQLITAIPHEDETEFIVKMTRKAI
jgi:hypothetical protein